MAKKDEAISEITNDTKEQLLSEALKQIEKQYGKGSIMRLGEHANVDVDAISTGSLAIDHALGVGGFNQTKLEVNTFLQYGDDYPLAEIFAASAHL